MRLAETEPAAAGPAAADPAARSAALVFLVLALLLLGLAWTLPRFAPPAAPFAGEATAVMMTQSLLHDRDLAYDGRDLARLYTLWEGGPAGLELETADGGKTMRYRGPLAYALFALPGFALFGAKGFLVGNALLYLLLLAVAWRLLAGREVMASALLVGGFFFASAAFVDVFRLGPQVLEMACVFLPLAAGRALARRASWGPRELLLAALSGGLAGAALTLRPLLLIVALPLAADLVRLRRFRGLAALAVGVLLVAGGLTLAERALGGRSPGGSPAAGAEVRRASFRGDFPLEHGWDLWRPGVQARTDEPAGGTAGRLETDPRVLWSSFRSLLFGRFTGLLPYFPFALFALVAGLGGRRETSRRLLWAALAAYALVTMVALAPAAGDGLAAHPLAAVYPAFLLLLPDLGPRRGLALPFAAAALWTAAVVAVGVASRAPQAGPPLASRAATFRWLPAELPLLARGGVPGYAQRIWAGGMWIVPVDNFFVGENHKNGVWVRGRSTSEVVVVTPEPIGSLAFRVHSLAADDLLTLEGGGDRVRVRFDTLGKRQGTPIELPVTEVAHDLGGPLRDSPHEHYYRIRLTVSGGELASKHFPNSADWRFLGVFLDFTGGGP